MARVGERDRPCPAFPATTALKSLGGRWKVPIVTSLAGGPMGYAALRRGLDGISDKMLAQQLRALEADGFLTRTELVSRPPKVVRYELTPLGTAALAALEGFERLGDRLRADERA